MTSPSMRYMYFNTLFQLPHTQEKLTVMTINAQIFMRNIFLKLWNGGYYCSPWYTYTMYTRVLRCPYITEIWYFVDHIILLYIALHVIIIYNIIVHNSYQHTLEIHNYTTYIMSGWHSVCHSRLHYSLYCNTWEGYKHATTGKSHKEIF